ncbi:AraC family transcriptional regulator [Paenibacillus sp. 1P07SE]|uniref:AraC family transcriptional regulator n=1 Tax=Paenibacillus sp. 1P07SE TaxID=3132209 RepID=UPI0039A53B18
MKHIERVVLPLHFAFDYYKGSTKHNWMHVHKGMEFLFIHSGKGTIWVNDRTYSIQAPCLAFFQPYQLHKVQLSHNSTEPYIRTVLKIEPEAMETCVSPFPILADKLAALWRHKIPVQYIQLQEDHPIWAELAALEQTLADLHWEEQWEQVALFGLQLIPVVHAGLNAHERSTDLQNREALHAERIMQWLEQHYAQPFSLERMAQSLHLSANHISHLFPRYAGMTVTDYLTAKRLSEACFRLSAKQDSIRMIGEQCGFSSASYFSQVFKRKLGVTPQAYRQGARPERMPLTL